MAMEVYIEYAFLQNFLFDGVLLVLALKGSRTELKWKQIFLSAAIGAAFALTFPFLNVKKPFSWALKICVAALICLIPSKMKTKKQRGRYLMTTVFFLGFTFAFGGAVLGLGNTFSTKFPIPLVFIGLLGFSVFALVLIEKLYQKRTITAFLYPCTLFYKGKAIKADGFFDTGNVAQKNGKEVCFLSPDLFYDLFGTDLLETGGQVCDEMRIQTINGEKTVKLFQGEILVENGREKIRKRVYFAPSQNSISQEYRLLLNARLFEQQGEKRI